MIRKCFGTRHYNFHSKICRGCDQNILCYEEFYREFYEDILCYEEFYRELDENKRCPYCHNILEYKNYGTILKCCSCDFKMRVPVTLKEKVK